MQLVDRDGAVRIGELPVELVRVYLNPNLAALRARARHVLDARELVVDEGRNRREDQDRNRRPDQLEPGRAVAPRAEPARPGGGTASGALGEWKETRASTCRPGWEIVTRCT